MITDCPHLVLDTAPWGVPYSLYDNLDNVFNFNNSIITSTCKEHIISKNVTIHTKDKPWMCIEVRYDMRKRDRCFKRTLSAQDQLNFYVARREANRAKRNAKKRFQAKVVDSLSDPNLDVRNVWKISNRIFDDKSDRKSHHCWKIIISCPMIHKKLIYLIITLLL